MNDEIIKKINTVKDNILIEKGGSLYVFALIKKDVLDEKFDLLISASWLEKSNSKADLIYVIQELKKEFSNNLDFLSQIVLLKKEQAFIKMLGDAIRKSNGAENILTLTGLKNIRINDFFEINELYIYQNLLKEITQDVPKHSPKNEKIEDF